jgi:hypothetical protein
MAKKTKSFVAISTVCLLVALSILPCFALSSDTSTEFYTPDTEVYLSIQYVTINEDFVTPVHHIPLTFTAGHTRTEGTILSNSNHGGFRSTSSIGANSFPSFDPKYTVCPQSSHIEIIAEDYDEMYLTITIRDLYIFDEVPGIDMPANNLKQSYQGYITISGNYWRFLAPDVDSPFAETKIRYREAGQEEYTTTEFFTMGSFDLHSSDYYEDPYNDYGSTQIALGDFTNLAFLDEEKLYHVDYIEITALVSPNPGNILDDVNPIQLHNIGTYVDITGIDNAMVVFDKSNIWLPTRDFTAWLGTATTGFFTAEIAPGFPIGGIVIMIISFALVIWFLKMFAGG